MRFRYDVLRYLLPVVFRRMTRIILFESVSNCGCNEFEASRHTRMYGIIMRSLLLTLSKVCQNVWGIKHVSFIVLCLYFINVTNLYIAIKTSNINWRVFNKIFSSEVMYKALPLYSSTVCKYW